MQKRDYWKDKKIFITGATGFVGSWLTKELVDRDAEVTILMRDNIPNSSLIKSDYIKKINIVYGQLEDYFSILRAINEYDIDIVFHLGAQAIVGRSTRNPISTFESNIKGTWNLLEAIRNCKSVDKTILSTSDKAYGTHDKLPYTENMALKGEYPYDVSKSCADLIAQSYYKTYGLKIGIARCGNIYGGGDLNFNRIIPGTIKSVYYKEQPVIRSDGLYIRDYIYVKDIIRSFMILCGNLDRKEVNGEPFNFSTGNRINVLDLVNLILKIMGSNLKPIILNQAVGEIRDQYLDISKAHRLLSLTPQYNVEHGLKETIKWYTSFFKQKHEKSKKF